MVTTKRITINEVEVPQNLSNQIKNILQNSITTEVNGAVHCHFVTTYIGKIFSKMKTFDYGNKEKLVIKRKRKLAKLEVEEEDFFEVLEQFAFPIKDVERTSIQVDGTFRKAERALVFKKLKNRLVAIFMKPINNRDPETGETLKVEKENETSFVKDLTEEGIESNPGPETSRPCVCTEYINGTLYYSPEDKPQKCVSVIKDNRSHPDNIKVDVYDCEKCGKQGYVYTLFTLHMTDHEIDIIMSAIHRTPLKLFDPHKFVEETNKRDSEIKIPFNQVKVYSTDEMKTFILNNGINFDVPTEQVITAEDHYVVKVNSILKSDIFGYIKEKKVRLGGSNIIKVKKYQQLNKSTIWSNHADYQPSKRCTVFFKNTVEKLFGAKDFTDQLEGSLQGAWRFASTLLLVPKDSMVFRFSGQTYVNKEVNANLYNRVLSSVIQQEMTVQQLAETIVILTQIQFASITFDMSYDCIFSVFYLLITHNMHSLTYKKQVDYSIQEVWDEVFKLRPPMQVFDVELKKSVTTPVEIQTISKFNMTVQNLKSLTENYFASIVTDEISLDDLITLYKSGILSCFENIIKPLRFHAEDKICVMGEETPQLNEKQRFVKRIIDLNMTEVDITEVFNRVIDISRLDTDEKFLKDTIRMIARFRIDSMYQPGLKKLNEEPIPTIIIHKPEVRLKQKHFMNKNLLTEKKIAIAASSQYYAYCKIFNVRAGVSPYSNIEYVYDLAVDRRHPIKTVAAEDVIQGEEEEEVENLIGANELTFMQKMKRPFELFRNVCKNAYKASENLANVDGLLNQQVDKVIASFEGAGLLKAAGVMKEMNFNTIKDSFASIKHLITGYFQDFLSKICSLFGVSYDCNIDPFTLFTYYLLWTKSQCEIVKKFIIGVILIELGIADAFWSIIKNIYDGLKNLAATPCGSETETLDQLVSTVAAIRVKCEGLEIEREELENSDMSEDKKNKALSKLLAKMKKFGDQHASAHKALEEYSQNPENTKPQKVQPLGKYKKEPKTRLDTNSLRPTPETEFEQLLEDYANRIEVAAGKNKKIIKTVKKEIDNLPLEETNEGWMDYVWAKLQNATAPILGVMGTAIITTLGLKVALKDNNKIGEAIIKGARNVSFLALGLGAVPKIFTYVMSALNWIVDEVKGTLSSKHITKSKYISDVSKFLQDSLYIKGILEVQAVRSLTVCVRFMERFAQMKTLRARIVDLADHSTLRSEFSKRCQVMTEMFPVVKAAAVMHYGQAEICHIQFWSEAPGVGKTDLQGQIMRMAQKEFHDMEVITAEEMGIRQKRYVEQSPYPLQDNLDHNDAYYDQCFALIDEDTVMTNPDGDSIIAKMQMLSGSPTLSKQADLSSKGRLFRLKLILSNTNNAYLRPQNMATPAALHRRRILYKVTVNPLYGKLIDATQGYAVDEEKIRAQEQLDPLFNRTKGDHLLFTWMDPVKEEVKTTAAQNLPIGSFIKLLAFQIKEHYTRELSRALNKRPDQCYLRLLFEELMEDLTLDAPEIVPSELKNNLYDSKTILSIIKSIESKQSPELKLKYQNDLRTYSKIVESLNPIHDTTANLDLDEPDTKGFFGAVVDEMDYSLQKIKFGDDIYFMLAPGHIKIRKGAIDFDRFVLKKYQNHQYVMYKKLNVEEDIPSVGYWIQRFSSCISEADFKAELEICKAEERKESLKSIYKAKLFNLHNRTLRAIKSVGTYLKEMAIKVIGEPLFQGMIIAVSIYGMFISLHTIGYMLMPPQNAGYVQHTKPLHSFNLNKQQPVLKEATQYIGSQLPIDIDPAPELARKVTYKMRYVIDGLETIGTIIGIKGNIFLTCYHLVSRITKPVVMQIYDPKFEQNPQFTVKEFSVRPKDIRQIPNKDAALVYIEGFRPVRTALNHFVTEAEVNSKDLSFSSGYCVSTLLRNKDFTTPTKANWTSTDYGKYRQTNSYRHAKFPNNRTLEFECPIQVLGGDSGSLVLHDNPKIQNKFAGIILSVGLYTYIGMVTKEEIEDTLEKFEIKQQIVTPEKDAVLLSETHPLKKVFQYPDEVYCSPYRDLGISHSPGFRKTILFGKLQDSEKYEVAPAIQHENDYRKPLNSRHHLELALNKTNNEESPTITAQEKAFMIKAYEDEIITNTDFIDTIRIWSTKEAITGVKYRGSKRLNPHSSPGLPYKLLTNKKGKSEWIRFDTASQTWMISDYVYKQVEIYEKQLEMGYVPDYEPLEFRKKELVGLKKINNPKTRTVAACNMTTQIISNKIFNHLEMLIKNMWDYGKSTPFALGVDPERHWHQIALHLGKDNWDYVNDYDIDQWESKVVLEFLTMETQAKINVIKKAYRSRGEELPEKWERIAHGIAIGSVDAYVVFEDVMYRKRSGLLSGFPTTFLTNTAIQLMLTKLIARRILLESAPQYANIEFIRKNVRFVMAGDDVVIAISPLARQFITFERIAEEYKKLKFNLTAADKSENIQAKTIHEVQFLKHNFRDINGTFVADPKMNIIYQLLTWVRDEGDLDLLDQIEVNRHTAFRYLWWKGRETYERVREDFNTQMLRENIQWLYTFDEMSIAIRQKLLEVEERAELPNAMTNDFEYFSTDFLF